jgi:hypothetical protein
MSATTNPMQEADFGVGKTKSAGRMEMEDDFEERMSKQFGRGSKMTHSVDTATSESSDRMMMGKSFYIPDIKERMWTKEYIGLYCHYAAVGFVGGVQGILLNFCVFYFDGADNLCPNAQSIVFLPWRFVMFI